MEQTEIKAGDLVMVAVYQRTRIDQHMRKTDHRYRCEVVEVLNGMVLLAASTFHKGGGQKWVQLSDVEPMVPVQL